MEPRDPCGYRDTHAHPGYDGQLLGVRPEFHERRQPDPHRRFLSRGCAPREHEVAPRPHPCLHQKGLPTPMTSYTRPAGNKDASLPHTPPSHTSVHSEHRTRPPKERHTRLDVPAASETRLDSGAAPRRRKPGTWIEHNAGRRVDGNSYARPQGAPRSEGELEGNRRIARASRPRASTLVEPRRGAWSSGTRHAVIDHELTYQEPSRHPNGVSGGG